MQLIPREFVCYMGRRNCGLAELAGPSGRTWRFELANDGKDFYFTDGWRDFVKDNLVREGNFMFFLIPWRFEVQVVYDESMCEMEMVIWKIGGGKWSSNYELAFLKSHLNLSATMKALF